MFSVQFLHKFKSIKNLLYSFIEGQRSTTSCGSFRNFIWYSNGKKSRTEKRSNDVRIKSLMKSGKNAAKTKARLIPDEKRIRCKANDVTGLSKNRNPSNTKTKQNHIY